MENRYEFSFFPTCQECKCVIFDLIISVPAWWDLNSYGMDGVWKGDYQSRTTLKIECRECKAEWDNKTFHRHHKLIDKTGSE